MLLTTAGMRHDFAMCGLPQPDKAALFAEDHGVIPPEDHRIGTVRCGGYCD